jgi:hypothetical protein
MEDSCEHGNEPSGFHEILSVPQLAASKGGLSSMKLISLRRMAVEGTVVTMTRQKFSVGFREKYYS